MKSKTKSKPTIESLSKALARNHRQQYAQCPNCYRIFYDDVDLYGSIPCPYCYHTTGKCVVRGWKHDELDMAKRLQETHDWSIYNEKERRS